MLSPTLPSPFKQPNTPVISSTTTMQFDKSGRNDLNVDAIHVMFEAIKQIGLYEVKYLLKAIVETINEHPHWNIICNNYRINDFKLEGKINSTSINLMLCDPMYPEIELHFLNNITPKDLAIMLAISKQLKAHTQNILNFIQSGQGFTTEFDITTITINEDRLNQFTLSISYGNIVLSNINGDLVNTILMPLSEFVAASKILLDEKEMANMLLQEQDLSDAEMNYTNLQNTDFSYATLDGTNLRRANLRGTNFTGAKMNNVDLVGAEIDDNTVFEGANISQKFPKIWYDHQVDLYLDHLHRPETASDDDRVSLLTTIDSINNDKVKIELMRQVVASLGDTDVANAKEAMQQILTSDSVYMRDQTICDYRMRILS